MAWGWRCRVGGGGVIWVAVTTHVSQTGRRESFQSDGVNGLGLDDGAGQDNCDIIQHGPLPLVNDFPGCSGASMGGA